MKSSYCSLGECVDVEFLRGHVLVARSDRLCAALTFTREEWAAFLAGVVAGEFDLADGGA